MVEVGGAGGPCERDDEETGTLVGGKELPPDANVRANAGLWKERLPYGPRPGNMLNAIRDLSAVA